MKIAGVLLGTLLLTQLTVKADELTGMVYPSDIGDGPAVTTFAEKYQINSTRAAGDAYIDLLKYLLPAPNQGEAGSCLYMAHTGNVEFWLNRIAKNENPASEGATDISERYLMNISDSPIADKIENHMTDSIYLFNLNNSKAAKNSDYRFTKGWYKTVNGQMQKAISTDVDASYDASYNWINSLVDINISKLVTLPTFEREVLFKEATGNKWAINALPTDIVETIKQKLKERQAPVIVVYNHYLVWHAVMIVGWDDQEPTNTCKFTTGFPKYAREEADKAKLAGNLERAKFLNGQAQKIEDAMTAEGGCQPKGVFLVRDSIYASKTNTAMYDYDLSQTGDEELYSEKVVKKEYQWLKRFGNHAYQIYVK